MAIRRDQDDKAELSRLRDEVEQLRTALEQADEEFNRLVDHRDRLLIRVAAQARDLHAMNIAYTNAREGLAAESADHATLQLSRGQDEEELKVAFEELEVVTEELEVSNANLRLANEELESRVKERTQVLAESEERLRSAIKVGRLGLWSWNVRSGEVHWSDEHFLMEGYAVDEVAPSYEVWKARIHDDDRVAAEAALQHAMATREEYVNEFRVVHPDGSVHWLLGRGRFFYEKDGQPDRMVGAMIETTDRRVWEERQKVLIAELQHRTRNLLGVVRSIATRTGQTSTDLVEFMTRFQDRLDALGRAQGLLSRLGDLDRVTFDDLIRTELSAMSGASEHVTMEGPTGVRLRSSTVQTLAMALHELATNAVKYGALGQADARLAVSWSLEPDGELGRPWLHIDWRETEVVMSPPSTVARLGQGRELIEHALPYQLGAKTSYTIGSEGVHCTIAIPVSAGGSEPGRLDADE